MHFNKHNLHYINLCINEIAIYRLNIYNTQKLGNIIYLLIHIVLNNYIFYII